MLKCFYIACLALLTMRFTSATASAGPWADVICSYEAGANPNTGFTNPNALFTKATSDDDPDGIVSLGMYRKSTLRGEPVGIIAGFSTSIPNVDGNDLLIVGNARTGWYEPGYVEVARESSGPGATANGWEDETFYLLKPSNYDQVGDPRTDGPLTINWSQDNFDNGLNPYTDAAWADQSTLTGYADVTPGGDALNLDWAIDLNGDPVSLADIAYVRIRTVTDGNPDANPPTYAGVFGVFSTDLDYIQAIPEPTSLGLLGMGMLTLLHRRR